MALTAVVPSVRSPAGRSGAEAQHTRQPLGACRYDVQALKRAHPIAEVVATYGVELRPGGRAHVGRCPLHDDHGRPNLYVYPDSDSYFCYRCDAGGDAVDFVMRRDRLDFLEACARLAGMAASGRHPLTSSRSGTPLASGVPTPSGPDGPSSPTDGQRSVRERRWDCLDLEAQLVMNCAVAVYQRRLWQEPRALEYLRRRRLPEWVIRECALGYADGHSLEALLRRRSLIRVAQGLGLFRRGPSPSGGRGVSTGAPAGPDTVDAGPLRETIAGRIVVPELRHGQAIWFIGRSLYDRPRAPRYLALAGERPVLGYERVAGRREAFLCEGVFDYLTAVGWRLPAFSPCGTHLPPERLGFLARARAVFGVFDADDAGREATVRAGELIGPRWRPLALPEGCDLNDLGRLPEGRATFFALLSRCRRARLDGATGAGTGASALPPSRSGGGHAPIG